MDSNLYDHDLVDFSSTSDRFLRQDTLSDLIDVIKNDSTDPNVQNGLSREDSVDMEKIFAIDGILTMLQEQNDESESAPGQSNSHLSEIGTSTPPSSVLQREDEDTLFGVCQPPNAQSDSDNFSDSTVSTQPPSVVIHHYPRKRKASAFSIKSEPFYGNDNDEEDEEEILARFREEKRARNNEAVRRSRKKSKDSFDDMVRQCKEMETNNLKSRNRIKILERELADWKRTNEKLDFQIKKLAASRKK